jgi:hypothetical protein
MQEKNLERAKTICNFLDSYRTEIRNIKNLIRVKTAIIKIDTVYKDSDGNTRSMEREVNIIALGDDILKFILNQKRLHLQGRILELEAELRTL